MRQPFGRAADDDMGFLWQGRTLLCKPQQGAGLCINQCKLFIISLLIKAPPWTGGLLLPCPRQDIQVVVQSCMQCCGTRPGAGGCHEPTLALPGGLLQQHWHKCPRPSCSHGVVPTAALPDGLPQRQRRRCPHLSCSHCVVGLPGGPPLAAMAQVSSSQLQPFCRAHCRTARWPPLAALEHVPRFQRQPVWCSHCSNARCPPAAAAALNFCAHVCFLDFRGNAPLPHAWACQE